MSVPEEPIDAASRQPTSEVVEVTTVDPEIVDPEVLPSTAADTPLIPAVPDPDYTAAGVPTFDFVRDKIENRISTALGSQELAEATPEGQQVDEMIRKRDEAAKKKLDEIRKSTGR